VNHLIPAAQRLHQRTGNIGEFRRAKRSGGERISIRMNDASPTCLPTLPRHLSWNLLCRLSHIGATPHQVNMIPRRRRRKMFRHRHSRDRQRNPSRPWLEYHPLASEESPKPVPCRTIPGTLALHIPRDTQQHIPTATNAPHQMSRIVVAAIVQSSVSRVHRLVVASHHQPGRQRVP
jgi:hypothetical protein